MHVTTWALINGEREHGISWHWMVKEIDGGGVLKEKRFPVRPDDTATSLNTKCFEAGFEAFCSLLTDLEQGTLANRQQVEPIPGGYYALRKRPERMSTLDWSRPAEELDAPSAVSISAATRIRSVARSRLGRPGADSRPLRPARAALDETAGNPGKKQTAAEASGFTRRRRSSKSAVFGRSAANRSKFPTCRGFPDGRIRAQRVGRGAATRLRSRKVLGRPPHRAGMSWACLTFRRTTPRSKRPNPGFAGISIPTGISIQWLSIRQGIRRRSFRRPLRQSRSISAASAEKRPSMWTFKAGPRLTCRTRRLVILRPRSRSACG